MGVVNVTIIKEDIAEMRAEISLAENMVYIVKDGQVYQVEPPVSGHGEQSLIYKNKKVIRIEKRESELI